MRVVGGVRLQALYEAVLEVVGEIEASGVLHSAVRLRQAGVALGADASRAAVVGDAIGLEQTALVIDLNVPSGGDRVLGLVIDELAGLDDHAGFGRYGFAARRDGGEESRAKEDQGEQAHDTVPATAGWRSFARGRSRAPRKGSPIVHHPSSE